MRTCFLTLMTALFMVQAKGQELTFKNLVDFSGAGTTYAGEILKKRKWTLVNTAQSEGADSVALVFTKDSSSFHTQVIVVIDQPERQSYISYNLDDTMRFVQLQKEAVALGFDTLEFYSNDAEQVYSLIRDSSEVVNFHTIPDSAGSGTNSYFITIYSYDQWLTGLLPSRGAPGWEEGSRLDFLDQCFKQGAPVMTAYVARKYCSCMLQKMEALYPDEDDAADISLEEMVKLAKECFAY